MNKNNELTRQDKARQWRLINNDCIKVMSKMGDGSVNLTLTDIPYDEVNMNSNGLRNLDKEKAKKNGGTTRQLIWEKTNPSPMNGQHIYLSGIEDAVWFKKRGATFNAYCKNTIFKYPSGRNKIHPTEKNHKLLEELILDNSNENDIVFDPCSGSASAGYVALANNRNFLGVELDKEFYEIAKERLEKEYKNN